MLSNTLLREVGHRQTQSWEVDASSGVDFNACKI
jgi:hypothetical protein